MAMKREVNIGETAIRVYDDCAVGADRVDAILKEIANIVRMAGKSASD